MNKDSQEKNLAFLVQRAHSINSYAAVEMSLHHLFSVLLRTDFKASMIIFFSITNTSSRSKIIQELLNLRHGKYYDEFWNGIPRTQQKRGLWKILNKLDNRRNEIVHWHSVTNIVTDNGSQIDTTFLMRPDFWINSKSAQKISTEDMAEFATCAIFASRAINMFTMLISGRLSGDADLEKMWHDICRKPCIYPPPEGHPLSEIS